MADNSGGGSGNAGREIAALRLDTRLNAATAMWPRADYFGLTRTLTYSYLFVLPLFILYEAGMLILSSGFGTEVRIGADVLLRHVLAFAGIDSTLWLAVLVIIAGAIIVSLERRKGIRLRPAWFGGMLIESTIYAVVVGLAVSSIVGAVFAAMPPLQIAGTTHMAEGLVLSLGAGLYEELLFRLILVSGLFAILRLLPIGKPASYALAAIIGALIFSWVHYIGPLGYDFTLSSFVFRALMGLALNALFLTRGFGIAAMTHAIYDVIVTIMA